MSALAEMKQANGDDPQDYLRDLAGAIRQRDRANEGNVTVGIDDAKIFDAIADLIDRQNARIGAAILALSD